MKASLGYFDSNLGAAELSLRQRCFRVLNGVACSWILLGAGLQFFTIDMHTRLGEKLHIAAFGCDCVALAIYSVILPLYFVLRGTEEPS
jgi:hypothetical protein